MSTPRIIVQAQEFVSRVVARGLRGERGQGVIPGGAQGQILGKRSDDDYDTEWLNPGDAPSLVNSVAATAPITSTGGVNPVVGITPATSSAPGSMSAADKAKLDNLLLSSAPPAVAASSQAGASTRAAREDHTHAHGAQGGGTLHANASGGLGGSAGFMSVADKNKLDGIQAGAQVNVATNLGIGGTGNARQITSSTGAAATLPIATQVNAGVMSVEDKAKLDGISPGATVYTNALARGQVELMLVAGSNVTFSYAGSGASRTLTINATLSGGGSGTVTSVQASGGSTGLNFSGGPITGAGTLTLGGTLAIASGGTGATTAEGARAAIGAGTVTSVGLSLPGIFSVTNSPVTSAGTIAASLVVQAANRVWAGPSTGADAAPTFRALVQADIPGLPVTQIRNLQEQRLFGSAQFVDSVGSGQLIELGTGFVWGPGTLDLSENLQGWHALAPSSKQDALTAGSGIDITDGVISATGAGGSSVRSITVGFRGGTVNGVDQALVTGLREELRAVSGLTPVQWTLLPKAGSTGDITVEIRKRPFASGTFASITGGSPPSISAGARGTGSASAWDAIDDGDLIEIEVTSVTGTVTGITLIIEATEA